MEELRLKYIHKRNWIHLVFGSAFLLLGLISSFFVEPSDNFYVNSWQIPFGIIYILLYFYQRRYNLIIINSDFIKSQPDFGKTIKLDEISRIKYFAGEFIVFKGEKKITIPTENLSPEDKESLKNRMNALNNLIGSTQSSISQPSSV